MEGRVALFLHIPKNSGTSLKSIVRNFYKQNEVYFIYERRIENDIQIYDLNDFYALSQTEKVSIKLYFGHYSFGLHQHIPKSCLYFTFLRDPYERIISLFYYVSIEEFNHRYLESIKTGKMSLIDFIRSGMSEEVDNHQTRVISGMTADYGKCSQEMLAVAKKNLRECFSGVGLSEHFRESVLLMKAVLGWRQPALVALKNKLFKSEDPFYEKVNVTPNRPKRADLTPDEIKAIEEFNGLDIELYQYGVQLFRDKLKQFRIQGGHE